MKNPEVMGILTALVQSIPGNKVVGALRSTEFKSVNHVYTK